MIVSASDCRDKPNLWFETVIDEMNTYTPEQIESVRVLGVPKDPQGWRALYDCQRVRLQGQTQLVVRDRH